MITWLQVRNEIHRPKDSYDLAFGERQTIWMRGEWSIVEQMGQYNCSYILMRNFVPLMHTALPADLVHYINAFWDTPAITPEVHEDNIERIMQTACTVECPVSRKEQIIHVVGFYTGFCSGRGWTINWQKLNAWKDRI
jgi:hypothetical protein